MDELGTQNRFPLAGILEAAAAAGFGTPEPVDPVEYDTRVGEVEFLVEGLDRQDREGILGADAKAIDRFGDVGGPFLGTARLDPLADFADAQPEGGLVRADAGRVADVPDVVVAPGGLGCVRVQPQVVQQLVQLVVGAAEVPHEVLAGGDRGGLGGLAQALGEAVVAVAQGQHRIVGVDGPVGDQGELRVQPSRRRSRAARWNRCTMLGPPLSVGFVNQSIVAARSAVTAAFTWT